MKKRRKFKKKYPRNKKDRRMPEIHVNLQPSLPEINDVFLNDPPMNWRAIFAPAFMQPLTTG